jgi:formiminotetrahydrofolate cyclodeaminase
MSRLTELPTRELLAAFASAAPTPGGGSAAALTASVGLSLLAMVASMSRTRNGSEEDRALLDAALTAVEHLGQHTLTLVDDDAASYDAVIEAYRKPRATEEEKVERRRAIEAALRGAAEVPLEVMRACRAGLTAAVDVARAGNRRPRATSVCQWSC